ncbi:carbohydrate porin [Cyanobium sp. Morenito 9A2]|uniref:carbohydrate porin n=1 Tax=Cyanobium sp. Morenito 9A2 TaxID=2823718 RepID=UPI0020CCA8AF|nr:carbohydrate porin [Cyanobium sp. Morenito 9A2]MCP9848434.1 carbohydrate porin [Cyanobium sp. Morenito 9A2]
MSAAGTAAVAAPLDSAWWTLEIQATAQPMANPAGGAAASAGSAQELDLALTLGTAPATGQVFRREIDRWQLQLGASLYAGDADLAERLGAVFALQSTAQPQGLWLTRLAIERRAAVGELGVSAGLQALDPTFLAMPAYGHFIHSAFNQTLNIAMAGMPVSPYAAPALVLTYRPTSQWCWRLGALAPQGDNPGGYPLFGARALQRSPLPSPAGGWLQIAQLERSWPAADGRLKRSGARAALPDGLLQLGGYGGRGSGSYAAITLPVGLPLGLANRLWAAASVGFDPATNPVPLYGQMGWLSQGVLPGRPADVLALAFGRSSFSPALRQSYEAVLEANYHLALGGGLSLQPALQWIANPGGQGRVPGILAATVQVQLTY